MRRPFVLAVWLWIAVILSGCSDENSVAQPSKAEVEAIEKSVVLPDDAEPLLKYARHYAGLNRGSHRIIRGIYILGDETGVLIKTTEELPVVFDGGCNVVTVEYDVSSASFLEVSCGGEA